jgi:uncharacterized protein YggE
MKKIVAAIMALIVIFILPWNRINWGKVSLTQPQSVTVTGTAKSIQKNQIATFTAGVDAVNDKKDVAVTEVNTKVAALTKAVKDFGIKEQDIKTQNLSVYQNEETYYDNGVQKSRKGQWRVNNSIEITLRDVTKASQLTDLLTNSGATNTYGPNFQFDDTSQAEKDLYNLAMKDATDKAAILAKSAGRKLGKVVNVVEGSTQANVYPMMKAADGLGGAPVEVGSGTVSTSLTVVFELL